MSTITVLKESGLTLFSSVSNSEFSETTSRDDSHLHRVFDEQGVEFAFDVSWNELEKFQAKPHSSRNLIALISLLPRFAIVQR